MKIIRKYTGHILLRFKTFRSILSVFTERIATEVNFTKRKSGIHHLYISRNTPRLPPKVLHNLGFSFLLGIAVVPGKIKDSRDKIHYGRCANVECRILNR